MVDLIIRNANAFGYTGLVDISIKGGRIDNIDNNIKDKGVKEIDAKGRFVSPGLVDAHSHLDKALISDRKGSNNESQSTLRDRIISSRNIKKSMTIEDVQKRATELIKLSVVNGITTIRTFVEADQFVDLKAVKGVLLAKEETRDLVDIQTIAFAQEGWFNTPGTLECGNEKYLVKALELGIDIIGGNVNKTVWSSSPEEQVDRMFKIAKEFDCDIDMHLDNADNSVAFTLPYLIEKTIENNYQGRVSAGHVIGISHVAENTRMEIIQKTKDAEITIVVLPSRIKLTSVREFMSAGVNISIGTDNFRDKFVYIGNPNLVERMLLLGRIIRITNDEELLEIYKMGTLNAAKGLRLKDYGLEKGKKADIVVFETESMYKAVMELSRCRYVIKNGRVVAESGELVVN